MWGLLFFYLRENLRIPYSLSSQFAPTAHIVNKRASHSRPAIWKVGEHKFKQPEYAVVNIQAESVDGLTKSACYYQYDAVEDKAMGLSAPFSSYATLPL